MNKKVLISILLIIIITIILITTFSHHNTKNENPINVTKIDLFEQEVKEGENIEIPVTNESIQNLYKMIELYYIPKIYDDFDSYSDNHFYMDKLISYDSLSDESKLYYAYKNIDKVERKWLSNCEELKSYYFNEENLYKTCLNNEAIIKKEYSCEEWYFQNVNRETLQESYHKMYGLDKEMPLKTFTMSYTGICLYSKEKNDFLCFAIAGGDETMDRAATKLEKAIKYHNYIEIYDRYIWIDYSETSANYNKSYYKSRFTKELINSEESKSEYISREIYDKGALYKHVFKLDTNDNYYWYSSERVE